MHWLHGIRRAQQNQAQNRSSTSGSLALRSQGPVARVSEAKEHDGDWLADLFAIWRDKHQARPVAVRQLDETVKKALDPQGRGRQHLAALLKKLVGTATAGFVLTCQKPAGRWGAATYALQKTGGDEKP
jgi:hypothetical protein